MRLTKRTNLAMRILMFCAVNDGRTVTKAEIASGCNSSENHTGQVVNQLAHLGYLETIRGRGGGLRLDLPAEDITVGRIMRDFEAEVPVTECFAGESNTCPLVEVCRLRDEICAAMDGFYTHMDGITLTRLVSGNGGLRRQLTLPEVMA